MTVTTSYSATEVLPPVTAYSFNLASPHSSITALAGGGFAVAAQDSQGYTDLTVYNSVGQPRAPNLDFQATGAKIVQLTNGNLVVVGITPTGSVDYRIYNPQAVQIGGGTYGRYNNASNVSLIATADGGFAATYQLSFGGNTDNDIYYSFRTADGFNLITNTNNGLSVDNDQDASIVELTNGNFAMAFDRTDSMTGATSVYYEVFNSSAVMIKAETLLNVSGTVAKSPSLTALQNGGFAITFENNAYSTGGAGPSDILEANLSADGTVSAITRLDSTTGEDSQAAAVTLSDGTVLTVFTNAFSSTDNDINFAAYNQATGLNTYNMGLPSATSSALETNASVSAMKNDQFAVSYTTTAGGTTATQFAAYVLTRFTSGDNLGDTIVGDTERDVITAGSGNDTITPGAGADNQISAGLGYDTLILAGPSTGYTFARAQTQSYVTGPDGSLNQMSGIEKLQFSDRNVYIAPETRDLDGDGDSDILMQKTDGSIAVWLMNGATVTSAVTEATNPGSAWSVKGTGNFNSATDNYDDILMQNTSTGALQVWEMNGAVEISSTTLATNPGTALHAITTGDFNGDGKVDIVLQNDNGSVGIWLMNGTAITSNTTLANSHTTWHVVDTGDFNDDGKSDLLWQNSADGSIKVWTMNGGTVLGMADISTTPGAAWQIKSSGDFNGDGNPDILFQNSTTAQFMIWTMSGTAVVTKTVLAVNPGTAWHVLGSADYNGDGKSDIETQNNSGLIQLWMMNGTTILSRTDLTTNPGTSWHVIAGTGG